MKKEIFKFETREKGIFSVNVDSSSGLEVALASNV